MAIVAGANTGFKSPIVHAMGNGTVTKYRYRNGLGMMPSAEFNVFHDDFTQAVASNVPTGWSAAVIDTGATVVTGTAFGSTLIFDSDGAAEGAAIYLPKGINFASGKKWFIETRVNVEVADDCDLQFGLSDLTATTNPEDLYTTTAANLIAFGVLDGDATVGLLCDKSNGGTSVSLGTIDLVSATNHVLAVSYDGVAVHGWVDGQRAVSYSTAATIPTATFLAPFIAYRNGSSANNEGHVDYFRFAFER
jgi:hypothetical protein